VRAPLFDETTGDEQTLAAQLLAHVGLGKTLLDRGVVAHGDLGRDPDRDLSPFDRPEEPLFPSVDETKEHADVAVADVDLGGDVGLRVTASRSERISRTRSMEVGWRGVSDDR
jgi:hypothetical protein